MPGRDRQKKFREARRKAGYKRVEFWLLEAPVDDLEEETARIAASIAEYNRAALKAFKELEEQKNKQLLLQTEGEKPS